MCFDLLTGHTAAKGELVPIQQAHQGENIAPSGLIFCQQGDGVPVIQIHAVQGHTIDQLNAPAFRLPLHRQIGQDGVPVRTGHRCTPIFGAQGDDLRTIQKGQLFRGGGVSMQFNPVHAHSPVPEFDSAAIAVPPNPPPAASPSDTSSRCAEGFLPARSFCCGQAHRCWCRQEER